MYPFHSVVLVRRQGRITAMIVLVVAVMLTEMVVGADAVSDLKRVDEIEKSANDRWQGTCRELSESSCIAITS